MNNITIIGSGSFGCAVAYVLQQNNNIKIWSYTDEECNYINNNHSCLYLKECKLKESIKCYKDYKEAIKDSEYIIIACPSSAVRNTCKDIKEYFNNQKIIVTSKGMDKESLLSDVIKEELGVMPTIISGPSHAEQMVKNMPTYVNYSGDRDIEKIFNNDNFKLIYNEDYIGIEIGGFLKNPIAIAEGIIEGMGYKSNTSSYIVTEGLKEIVEIGTKLGAKKETFYDLAGLGDLLTTSLSMDSRNKRAGLLLAQNKTLEEIKEEVGMTIEGIDALNYAYDLVSKYNLNCPIITNLYKIVYQNENINNILNF